MVTDDTAAAITGTAAHFGSSVIKHTVITTIAEDIPVAVDFLAADEASCIHKTQYHCGAGFFH